MFVWGDMYEKEGENKMAKRKKNIKRLMGYSMTMGGAGLIAGALPAGAAAPVRTVTTTGSKFVTPMAATTGAGMVMGTLGELKFKKRKRRRR